MAKAAVNKYRSSTEILSIDYKYLVIDVIKYGSRYTVTCDSLERFQAVLKKLGLEDWI